MKNQRIKILISVMAIWLFLSFSVLTGCEKDGTKAVVANAIEETSEQNPEEIETGETAVFDLNMVPEYSGIAYADINDDIPFFTEDELTSEPFHEYWPLDEHGRCTGAFACIGLELLPSETRGSSNAIKPTGWRSVQYDGIDGGYLYNRCHLIGYQLTGQAANENNLITGTRYMNLEGMLPFENSVRMYVEGTGNHVLYRVRPYYSGNDLLAKGVLMEAKSIEDPLVQFCAFCYNVQPGIEIDYATGESFVIESISGNDEILSIVSDPEVENDELLTRSKEEIPFSSGTEDINFIDETKEITYVLNTNTKKFHYPYCDSVYDIKEKNKQETTLSRDEIIGQGYQPCKRCNP